MIDNNSKKILMARLLFYAFMTLVRFARLLLRHTVKDRSRSELPSCVTHMLGELKVNIDCVIWHELWCFKTVDGLIQGYNVHGQRVLIAWVDMNEIFRLVQFSSSGKVLRYQVTVTPYIWEPLLAEQSKARQIEEKLDLDTSLNGCLSKTFVIRRDVSRSDQVIELRQCFCRRCDSSDHVQCLTEKRLYALSSASSKLFLHKHKWWNGDEETLPREEKELWYEYGGSVYKRIMRSVDKFGDAVEKTYIGDSQKPHITRMQKYNETSYGDKQRSNVRRRKQHTQISNLGESVLYNMPSIKDK